ncbi:MAG TPA: helix-turn-helix domain-containing protein [Candidatus Sulfotelmatobacter sp.]|nr:helix-turn-helix domain-containing protein [Candidatus Sulfotelmatobacter sp.]
MSGFKIGTLAKQTGTSVPTIRYYEEIRLLRRAERQAGGQRVYKVEDVNRLTLIRRCRDFGFSIEQVRLLIAIMQGQTRSCMDARDLAQQHLTAVRNKVREMRVLERNLAAFVAACDSACAGGPGPDCVILEDLGGATKKGMF